MRILAIDGGGIRGIYAAHVLARIEKEFGVVFHRDFDLIAGTSTGAILAAALATGVPLSEVVRLYHERAASIFRSRFWSLGGLLFPKYSTEPLRSALANVFGEAVMASAKTRLLIPSTDIGNGDIHVVKSAYDPEFTRDPQRRLVDVIVASCSAPLFFRPTIVDRYLLCDGGLWANNPAIVAVTEAITRLGKDRSEIRLLSIGTGIGHEYYRVGASNWGWGFVFGWRTRKFISMLINLQTITANNISKLLLKEEQMVRVTFETDSALALDDIEAVSELVSRADRDFTRASDRIRSWLTGGA